PSPPCGATHTIFWVGSLMSQVLQCTQFCALICKRSSPASVLTNSYTPAGQYRASGPAYLARLTDTGMEASFSVRCTGSFSSWLVFEINTELSLSKVSLPSGFGYSICTHSEAGCRQAWSGLLWCKVHGILPLSSHCSTPVISVATVRPFLRSEEHTSELQSRENLVCRLLLE